MKDDVISRQAVLDEISKLRRNQQLRDDSHNADHVMHGLYLAEKVVEELPSVQPRMGKWHGKGDSEGFGIFICDNCGKFAMMEYDFCPNCGCRMEEGD